MVFFRMVSSSFDTTDLDTVYSAGVKRRLSESLDSGGESHGIEKRTNSLGMK